MESGIIFHMSRTYDDAIKYFDSIKIIGMFMNATIESPRKKNKKKSASNKHPINNTNALIRPR